MYALLKNKYERILHHWPYSRATNLIHRHPLSFMFTFLWKWSMLSSVIWKHLGKIIRCLTSNGKVEFSSLSPTLLTLWSSIKGSIFKMAWAFSWSAWVTAPCELGLQFHSWMLSVETPKRIRILVPCHSATVWKLFWFILLEKFSQLWDYSDCPRPVKESCHTVD